MSFVLKQGRTKMMYFPMTASTALSKGTLVALSSGLLIAATSTTAAYTIVGVLAKDIAATDVDYATSGRLVPVEVPIEKNVTWLADFSTTSLVSTSHLGIPADLADSGNVNVGATTYKVAVPVQVISTTKGVVVLLIGPDRPLAP